MTPTEQGARNQLRSICTMLQAMTANSTFSVRFQQAMSSGDYAEMGRLITETYRCNIASQAGAMPEFTDYDLCMGEDADIDETIPCTVSYVIQFGYVRVLSVMSEHNGIFIDWLAAGLLVPEAMNSIMDKITRQLEEAA